MLGSTGAGGVAEGMYAGVWDGTSVGVGAMVGAGGGVVVSGVVGTTAPVGPTGSRDTTRTADRAMATATSAMALSAITTVAVPYHGSRSGSSMAAERSRPPVEHGHVRTFRRRSLGRARAALLFAR
jgi:hypothetical protein